MTASYQLTESVCFEIAIKVQLCFIISEGLTNKNTNIFMTVLKFIIPNKSCQKKLVCLAVQNEQGVLVVNDHTRFNNYCIH